MPIPKTRAELTECVTTTYERLRAELDEAGPGVGALVCVDGWSVKDLLAVRCWWTEHVVDWVEAGLRGESPETPAPGYKWNETPRLNDDIVKAAHKEGYRKIRNRLQRGLDRVITTIETLDDRQLLEAGVFEWADRWPVSRWISINTARQYETARTQIRRALRERASRQGFLRGL